MLTRRFAVSTDDKNRLRRYLLGELSETEEAEVEVRLLSDESYFEELELVENELIDEYAWNTAGADERTKLEKRLLRSKQQQQKLAFAMALDAESEERAKEKEKVVPPVSPAAKVVPLKVSPARWASISPYLKIAAGVVLALGLSLSAWMLIGRKTDVERGMIALNQAQGNERLVQSRISDLNYAEMRTTRGNERPALQDAQARDYSELLFRTAVNEKEDAAAYHALGRLYLAERNFDKAREQFEKALAKDPNDAQLQSDMGAVLLELGQIADETRRIQYFGQASEYFERALQLNPSLPEALFNRALVYQDMRLPQAAKDAWRKYLEIDSTSPWAREAERNLKALEEQEEKGQTKRTESRCVVVSPSMNMFMECTREAM